MAESYIISIDQSTQGTKALLFDRDGMLLQRKDLPHKQIINEKGWVSHDPEEIYQNTVQVVKNLVEESGISKESVKGIGISNQRETSLIWEKKPEKRWQMQWSGNVQGQLKSAAVWSRPEQQR